jgi:hypothetical protein
MGFISDVITLTKLANKIKQDAGLDSENMKTAAACWSKAKAISAQAAKYVMEYPVACSSQITDYKKALAIAKQVELDCARFVILASGLNPIVDRKHGDTIEAHLNSMVTSFESYGVPCTIEPATTEFINAGREYMDKYFSTELYHTYKDEEPDNSVAMSTEAIGTVNAFNDEGDDENVMNNSTDLNGNDYDTFFSKATPNRGESELATFKEPTEDNFKELYFQLTGQKLKTPDELKAEGVDYTKAKADYDAAFDKYSNIMKQTKISMAMANARDNADILRKLQDVGPTIVTITLYLTDGAGGQRAIQLPLAIKSSLQFVDSIDLMTVLSRTDTNNRKLDRFIKVTSGQMGFFKDWLASLSEINEDIDREKALGKVPIFRRLMDAKNRYRIKSIAETRPRLAKFIAGKNQKDLPMCTIVCTVAELEEAYNQKWTYIYRTRKIIDEIIDTYMLLGFGVVDTTSDYIYLFYAGESEPQIIAMDKLGNNASGDNTNKSLAEAIANTTRLLARH